VKKVMNTKRFDMKKFFTLITFVFVAAFSAFADGDETENGSFPFSETKNISRSFPSVPNMRVEVINKYGDVQIETWNKDSVRVEVNITAQSDDMEDVRVLLDMADVDISGGSGFVLAQLNWGQNQSAWKRSAVEVMLNLNKDQRLNIDYTIYMPANLSLKIDNRFGNVVFGDFTGKTYLQVMHGDVRAHQLKDLRSAVVKYGRMDIDELGEGTVSLSFGEINCNKVDELSINSSSSEINIEKVNALVVSSTSDKFDLEYVGKISGSGMLSNFRIRELTQKLVLTAKFGSVSIRKVKQDFEMITLSAYSNDVSIGFESQAAFAFGIQLENGKNFTFPQSMVNIEDDELIGKIRRIKGSFNKGTSQKVTISGKSTTLRFEYQD
jgi:hypothetical protein